MRTCQYWQEAETLKCASRNMPKPLWPFHLSTRFFSSSLSFKMLNFFFFSSRKSSFFPRWPQKMRYIFFPSKTVYNNYCFMPGPLLWWEVEILEHKCKCWKLKQNQSVFKSRGDYSKMYCDAKIQYRNLIAIFSSKSSGIRTVWILWLINSNKCHEIRVIP